MSFPLAGCSGNEPTPAETEPQLVEYTDDQGVPQSALLAPGAGLMVGIVQDEAGVPIPMVHVALLGTSQAAVTSARGSFQFLNLEAGRYMLRADSPGHESLEQSVDIRGMTVTGVTITLVPAMPTEPGVAQTRPAAQMVFPMPSEPWIQGTATALVAFTSILLLVLMVRRRRNVERIANRAFNHLSKGQLRRAEELARRAVTRDDSTWTGWFVLGATLIKAGRYEEAVQHLEKASRSYDPKVAGLAFLITLACQRLGQPERSRRWLPLVARDQAYWDALENDPDTAFVSLTRTLKVPRSAVQDPSYG